MACAALATMAVSCAGVAKKMQNAREMNCIGVVDQHESIARDEGYLRTARVDRMAYEREVAECALEDGVPEKALALAQKWIVDSDSDRLEVEARAYALMNKKAESRQALEALVELPKLDPSFFADAAELVDYSREDWFVALAIQGWSKGPGGNLLGFVNRMTSRHRVELLPLGIAAADLSRPPGDMVLWLGLVRKARIDRNGQRTILHVEGADVEEELRGVDRKVKSVEGKLDPFNWRKWESVPSYSTERYYAEELVPTGQHFVVIYPSVSERMATMNAVVAFGRYTGRDPDDRRPVVTAELVAERKTRQRTERSSD